MLKFLKIYPSKAECSSQQRQKLKLFKCRCSKFQNQCCKRVQTLYFILSISFRYLFLHISDDVTRLIHVRLSRYWARNFVQREWKKRWRGWKQRTDRWSGVCNGFVSAIFVALIRTIRAAVAPVDTLDALVPGDAFELGGCAFPFCLCGRLCRSRNTREQRTHIYIYRYVDNAAEQGMVFCSGGLDRPSIEEEFFCL